MADSGMVDLGDVTNASNFMSNRTDFGMVNMSDIGTEGMANARRLQQQSKRPVAPLLIESHSDILTASSNAVTLSSEFALKSANPDEKDFWKLFNAFLADAERTPSYCPEKIGINLNSASGAEGGTSSAYSASRLWYITHYAYLQDLLMRSPTLRRATLILRWLESTYGERYGGYRSFRFAGRAHNTEEVAIMREAIRSALRSGELNQAIQIAEAAADGVTACMVSTAQMKAHPEAWNAATAVVPLFGEYAHGDEPMEWGKGCHGPGAGHGGGAKSWSTNKDRIDHLSNLLDWSEMADVDSDEAIIAAILSGNEVVLQGAFDTKRWQDELWVAARCALIKVFTKAISANGEPIVAGPFRDRVEAYCPPSTAWAETASQELADKITSICNTHLARSLLAGSNASLPFAEELQLRLILQSISGSSGTIYEASAPPAQTPLYAAVNVVACRAYSERLMPGANPQATSSRRPADNAHQPYTSVLSEYCCLLLTSPRLDLAEGMKRACLLLFTISSIAQRAMAVAQLVLAARAVWYQSCSSQSAGGSSSPTNSRAEVRKRRAFVAKQEQWLLEFVRKSNNKRFPDSDKAFVAQLLTSLGARMDEAYKHVRALGKSTGGSPTTGGSPLSAGHPPFLASDEKAESQMWRIFLWLAAPVPATLAEKAQSVEAMCLDISGTVTTLWREQRHFKAIKEVMNLYTACVAPKVVDDLTAAEVKETESLFSSSVLLVKELTFWELMAQIMSAWDALSTLTCDTVDLFNDHKTQTNKLELVAAEERKLRHIILHLTIRALAFESHFVAHNPSCIGALLKCAELNANAALVGINFPRQSESIASICQSARDQILLLHSAIALAPKEDAQGLFGVFRMLRLDAGVVKLSNSVAAALA